MSCENDNLHVYETVYVLCVDCNVDRFHTCLLYVMYLRARGTVLYLIIECLTFVRNVVIRHIYDVCACMKLNVQLYVNVVGWGMNSGI